MSRIEQSGRMSLRKPKPPIKGGSAPEEEEEEEEEENWITCVQDRAKWKDVTEKAKTSN